MFAHAVAVSLISDQLLSFLEVNHQTEAIYDNTLLFLKHPGITEGRLLSLFHMTKTFLIKVRCLWLVYAPTLARFVKLEESRRANRNFDEVFDHH